MGILIFSLSLCLGSFLNLCIHRIPLRHSILTGRSHCPSCHRPLLWRHKIPVISYILLRGRCFWCQERISLHYPGVEVLTAIISWVLFEKFGLTREFIASTSLVFLLIVAVGIDVRTMRIPNPLILFGMGVVLLVKFFGDILLRKESLGLGDVKLTALMGLYLGPEGVLWALSLALLLGGATGILGLLSRQLNSKSKLPFALFLACGTCFYLIVDEKFYLFILSHLFES